MLARLSRPGLVQRLRAGIWKIGPAAVSADVVLPVLTRPYPSYISLWSALFDHGMLDQVPRSVYAASLARPQAIKTSVCEYRAHHVHPDFFGGFEGQTAVKAVAQGYLPAGSGVLSTVTVQPHEVLTPKL
jgi:predicted transcriptional regulator of viral defense system